MITAHADTAGLAGGRLSAPGWVVVVVAIALVGAAVALLVGQLRGRKGGGGR